MRRTKRFGIWIGVVVIVLVILMSGISFVLLKGILSYSVQLTNHKQLVAQFQSDEQSMGEYMRVKRIYATEFDQLDALFVDPETPIAFITFLEGIAADTNFSLQINPGNPKKLRGEPWPSMDFRLSSEGSYSDFLIFLQRLETSSYLMEIKNISINRVATADGEAGTGQIQFSVLVKTYTSALSE